MLKFLQHYKESFKNLRNKFVALFRLDMKVVCVQSQNMGIYDFHDYSDGLIKEPWHFYVHTCERCGKKFYI